MGIEEAKKAGWRAITSDPKVFMDYLERPVFERALDAFLSELSKTHKIVPLSEDEKNAGRKLEAD